MKIGDINLKVNKLHLNGTDFINMIGIGSQLLQANVARINALNVFPVPDGDTGTNMNLTLQSGITEMLAKSSSHLGQTAEALSRGLLMGARGNSGVILSQLFRGFANSVNGLEQADVKQLSSALLQGVETAYKAVVKPVEGTILTVSKQAANHSADAMSSTEDIVQLFKGVQLAAQVALDYTPEQLPILKQVGVVDAGGQGLVHLYEGFVKALSGEVLSEIKQQPIANVHTRAMSAQSHIATEDIEYGYCTEFIISLHPDQLEAFNEQSLRTELEKLGDSLLVVADKELVKVHIHAERPGTVMNHAMQFGELTRIKIDNMRDQHAHIIHEEVHHSQPLQSTEPSIISNKQFGILSVTTGDGISRVFRSLGVDHILEGGQSMNPSTEEIVNAVNAIAAQLVYILPNNPNVILAAKQASELAHKEVIVIPCKTIPQGLAAVLAFDELEDSETNEAAMLSAMMEIRSGSITTAIRDSNIDLLEIRENDYLGMLDNKLVVSNSNKQKASELLLAQMIERGDEIVTIFSGEGTSKHWTEEIESYIENNYPDIELEIHEGGQPLYHYIISVE
jgi:DAK2 domain fusion protein YloV